MVVKVIIVGVKVLFLSCMVRVAVELENGSSEAGGKTVGEVQEVVPLKGISKAREGQQKVGKGSSGAL